MDEASRNSTLWALDSLLDVKSDYMGEEESQKNMEIIANLMTSTFSDTDASYLTQSEFQVSMLNYAELFGAKILQGTIRDQQSNVYTTDEFVMQPSRNSPEGLSEVKFLVPAGNSTAGAKVPKDFAVGTNVTALDSLDSFLVVTNFKGFKLINNETVRPEADTYVGPVLVISFSTKLSGVQDVTGKVKELPVSVLLNFTNMPSNATLTIPVIGIGSQAKPNCTWLNETGDYWTTKGCYLVSFSDSNVFCNCSHFTMFSVQSSGEGLIDAAQSANTEEAASLEAITQIDFSSNAAGLYLCSALIALYLGLVVVFYRWDKHDIQMIKQMKVKPHLRLKAVLNRHPHLYSLMADVEPASEGKALMHYSDSLKEINPTFDDDLVSPRPAVNLFRKRKQKQAEEVFDKVTRRRQTILLDYGVHPRIVDQQIDMEKVKPDDGFMWKVFINAYVPLHKTKWEYFVLNNPLLGLFFLVKPTEYRVSRLTVMTCILLGKLFTSGFFYNTGSADDNEEEKGLLQVLEEYTWYDFWLAMLSVLLTLPIPWVLTVLLTVKLPSRGMTTEEKKSVWKKGIIKLIIGYVIAALFIAFVSYEVTIFAIQFNANISKVWMPTFAVSTTSTIVVTFNLSVLLVYLIDKFKNWSTG
jgi:hypothetical protein